MSLGTLMAQNPLAVNLFVVFASLAIIIKAADYLVTGITHYSEKLGLSDYITGMIVVSMAASIPEFVSSIMGLVAEEPGVIFGTILGSDLSGTALVMGLLALVGRKINLKSKVIKKTEMIVFLFSVIPFILIADGILSRLDGVILLILYAAFTIILWLKEGELGMLKKQIKIKHIYKDALLFIIALAAVLLSARWMVFSSITAAKLMGINPYYVSLIVIGIGANVPDIIVGIRALLSGHRDVGIGDSLGSMLIKYLLFLGLIAVIQPLSVNFSILLIAVVFALLARGMIFYFTEKGSMDWRHGIVMVLLYISFIIVQLWGRT